MNQDKISRTNIAYDFLFGNTEILTDVLKNESHLAELNPKQNKGYQPYPKAFQEQLLVEEDNAEFDLLSSPLKN